MMRKLITITLLLLLITPCLRAQRKEISQARTYIKSGKDFDKAEKLMTELLAKDTANRANKKIYLTWYDAVKKQYEAGNEKLYLKQKFDTAMLFSLAMRMFTIAETLDSLDSRPDEKGRVHPEYRKKHAEELVRYRRNLYSGGAYFVRKGDYAAAYTYYDTFVDCERQPLFEANYKQFDSQRISQAAYWATYCGYKQSEPHLTLKHAERALADTSKASFVYEYMAEAYQKLNQPDLYKATLQRGFCHEPTFPYFFPHLVDYYTTRQQLDSVLQLTDTALAIAPDNKLFLFAKSTVLLNTGKYDESLELSEKLLKIDPQFPEAYYNAGTAYLNKILELESGADARKQKVQIKKLYGQALGYLEEYRKLVPDESRKWAPSLYKIYLNLNMGKQFEEIDAIMKK